MIIFKNNCAINFGLKALIVQQFYIQKVQNWIISDLKLVSINYKFSIELHLKLKDLDLFQIRSD